MTEKIARARARCEACHKVYRVPNPERTYACKACGGVVRGITEEPREPREVEGIPCPGCGTVNALDARFCSSCDGVLEETPALHRCEEGARARREATEELKRGHRGVAAVTWIYRLGAFAYAIVTLFAVLAMARADIPLQDGLLVVCLMTLLSVLMIMGAIQILFYPVAWTAVIASLATVVAIVHLVGPNPLGLAFYFSAFWAVVSWVSLVPTLRFHRMVDEHKDAYILHHSSGRTRQSIKGHAPEDRHERLLAVMHRAATRAWRVSLSVAVLFVAASALGTYTVVKSTRPHELAPVLEDFEASWNSTDVAGVGSFFLGKIRERKTEWLGGVTEGHGWKTLLPRLENRREREEDGHTWVDWDVADLGLSTRWALDGQDWTLIQMELPRPPIEPAFERFLEAWKRSDAEALSRFYRPDYQERMKESIERSARLRKWTTLPPYRGTRKEPVEEGKLHMVLELDQGEVLTKWYFRDTGRWTMFGLEFPPR